MADRWYFVFVLPAIMILVAPLGGARRVSFAAEAQSKDEFTRYLPKTLMGEAVLTHQGGSTYRVGGESIAYRRSKDVKDECPSRARAAPGSLIEGTDEGNNWVKVRVGITQDDSTKMCCCKGPADSDCELIKGSQLLTSHAYFNSGAPMCPHKQGWLDYSLYSFKSVPTSCPDWEPPVTTGANVTVKAYWMRHGWSCANALGAQGKGVIKGGFMERKWAYAASLRFMMYEDPGLTNIAIDRAKVMGQRVRDMILNHTDDVKPLVFTSSMVRAIETGYWNFPGWSLRPIPYISEMGQGYDNIPLPFKEQRRKLHRTPNPSDLPERLTIDVNPLDHPDRSSRLHKSNHEEFLRYFPSALAALYEEWEPSKETGEIPVVIVSHSGYMETNLQCKSMMKGEKKPRNNEVWVQKYTVQLGKRDAEMIPAGCERLIDEQGYYPKWPKMLCQDDIARCGTDWQPSYWLNQDTPACHKLFEDGFKDSISRDREHGEAYLANASSSRSSS